METGRKIPQHIAIILDGNGRWAKAKGMPRNYGHTAGAKNVETVCQAAHDLGVKYVTMYAFSTENWNRPEGEVEALMKLLESYLKNCIKTADKNNMRVRVIGDTTRLSERFQERIRELEAASAKNDGLNLQIAINYGSRDEMTRAMRRMSEDVAAGKRKPEEITESVFEEYLDMDLLRSMGQPAFGAGRCLPGRIGGRSHLRRCQPAKILREHCRRSASSSVPKAARKRFLRQDGTMKYLWELADGNCIESVLMRYHHGNTVCISSQVGCRMGCAFCASTIAGKVRNLTPAEMLDQVLFTQLDPDWKSPTLFSWVLANPWTTSIQY